MLAIRHLEQQALKPYLLLSRPGLRQFLLSDSCTQQRLALGASFLGQPVGLLLAHSGETAVHLLDLYVHPSYRQIGIGKQLLARLEQVSRQTGAAIMHTHYQQDTLTPMFQTLLAMSGWETPRHNRTLFCVQQNSGIRELRWIQRYHIRAPFQIIPWSEVTAVQKEQIRRQGKTCWYPQTLSPFLRPDSSWEAKLSFALQKDGEILGWILCSRCSEESYMCDVMFVDPSLQRTGMGIKLIAEMLRRFIAHDFKYGWWGVAKDNLLMQRWSRKALGTALIETSIEWVSEKNLTVH